MCFCLVLVQTHCYLFGCETILIFMFSGSDVLLSFIGQTFSKLLSNVSLQCSTERVFYKVFLMFAPTQNKHIHVKQKYDLLFLEH